MKTAYFDCIAGASGDMILGALVDAGLPLSELKARLDALHLPDFDLQARRVTKNAFSATKVDVIVADDVPERHLGDIIKVVADSDLDTEIKTKAIAIFRKIGEAEAGIHGTSLEEVHLHELGGVDTIVDVVGALVGLQALGIERVVVSPVPLGRGFIRGAHGRIPLPAPATVALLKGVPVVGSPMNVETVTPTGAALMASLGDDFGPIPEMALAQVGYGAGNRDMAIPNVLRLLIGESQ
ncbi:MAG: LarC family nickel insertion protein, partial [Anaerolineae bacterium]|nr:LarC family nickel insertion protein [Anaerolineae bacterium]